MHSISNALYERLMFELDQGQQTVVTEAEGPPNRYLKSDDTLLVRAGDSPPYWHAVNAGSAPHRPQPPMPKRRGLPRLKRLSVAVGHSVRDAIGNSTSSMGEVAAEVGTSRSSLINVLAGRQGVRVEVLEKLAQWARNCGYPACASMLDRVR